MRTLSDVFAARGPLLPEGLRTLEVSPNRTIEPGATVHVAFTFRNLGGGTASGFRVRFRLPDGLTYLVGTARIDDALLDEQGGLTTLLQTSGADIGEVPAGGERRIALSYTVANTIENGTPVALQAAVASFDVPVIGSNIVRLMVRSRPVLHGPKTRLEIAPVREALPGEELQLHARIHNSGQSSAHDLVALLPFPANTTFSPDSVMVEGRPMPTGLDVDPFGFARPTIVTPLLSPGATIDFGYRVRIDSPLEDATPIVALGSICSREITEFALPPATVKIPSTPSFSGEDTTFRVECDDEVHPGHRIRMVLKAKNGGKARARNLTLRMALPDGIAYTPGSLTLDAAPLPDHGVVPDFIEVGDFEPGRSIELALAGVVRTPIADGQELRVAASVEWSKGQRKFDRTIVARSAARFPASFNRIERESPRRVEPAAALAYSILLRNMGTDTATDARLQLTCDAGIERVHIHEGSSEIAVGDGGIVTLDTLEPGGTRHLRVDAHVAAVVEDQTALRLSGQLLTAQLEPVEIGTAVHIVTSRPRFTAQSSHIAFDSGEAMRPSRMTRCRVFLTNEGNDRGRDVRVTLMLPDELRLERVDNATADGNVIMLGDIAAGATCEAVLHLRLVGTVAHGDVLTIAARADGLNVVPVALAPVDISTHAEAAFHEGATLTSKPSESIDAGAELSYTLSLRNSGDGSAKRLIARVGKLENAVYTPSSTTINGIALQDFAGTSPLLSEAGLILADVGAGVEVIVRWQAIVNMPLPATAAIEAAAVVRWDEAPELTVVASPVRVRSASALPIIEPALPFSVLGAIAAPTRAVVSRAEVGMLPPPQSYLELLPAVPVGAHSRAATNGHGGSESGSINYARLPPSDDDIVVTEIAESDPTHTTVFLELGDEQLAWVVRYLEQTRVGGLVMHLLALRALVPDRVGGADRLLRARLLGYRHMLAEHADRLFIKVRLPEFPIQSSDVETPELRSALVDLTEELAAGTGVDRPSLRSGLRLVASIDVTALEPVIEELHAQELGTATPWRILTSLIGTVLERDGGVVAELSLYRDTLAAELARRGRLDANTFQASLREPVATELDTARDAVLHALTEQQRVFN